MESALTQQQLFGKDERLVKEVLDSLEVLELSEGDLLIGDGRGERDLFVVLTGCLRIYLHGEVIATSGPGDYVGEMALIDSGTPRTATVVAADRSTVGRLDEPTFTKLADKHPTVWRNLAVAMVRRLAALQSRCGGEQAESH